MIDGVVLTPLKIITVEGGDVLHAIKHGDVGECGFGEAYFSFADHGSVKAWKKHTKMTLNLTVPIGEIRFVIYDDRKKSKTHGLHQEIVLSKSNYNRLTVAPGLWVGFQGLGKNNMLMNFANLPHDPAESERTSIESIKYNWE